MTPKTRPVSWLRAALKEFEAFPEGARSICLTALTITAEGGKADIAKPMHGLGSGVFEIALPIQERRVPRGLCGAARQRHLGRPRLPEEIEPGRQDAKTRDRPY
jgi:hypothetical protein